MQTILMGGSILFTRDDPRFVFMVCTGDLNLYDLQRRLLEPCIAYTAAGATDVIDQIDKAATKSIHILKLNKQHLHDRGYTITDAGLGRYQLKSAGRLPRRLIILRASGQKTT